MSESSAAGVDIESVKLALSMITPVVKQDMDIAMLVNGFLNESIKSPEDVSRLINSFLLISSLLVRIAQNGFEYESTVVPPEAIISALMLSLEGQNG